MQNLEIAVRSNFKSKVQEKVSGYGKRAENIK